MNVSICNVLIDHIFFNIMSEDLPLATSCNINLLLTQIFDADAPTPDSPDYGYLYKKTDSPDLFWLTQSGESNLSTMILLSFGTATSVNNGAISILNQSNTRAGTNALITFDVGTNGGANTAYGRDSLKLLIDTSVNYANTSFGYRTGSLLTNASNNIYIGYKTGAEADSSTNNIGIGCDTLNQCQTPGDYNIAIGNNIMQSSDMDGNNNAVVGHYSLQNCTSGINNTVIGNASLSNLTEGTNNTAIGSNAGIALTTANHCIFIGGTSGQNTNADKIIAIGGLSLYNSTGANNLGIGYLAGYTLISGINNIIIGNEANVVYNDTHDSILISNGGKITNSNQVRIGFDVDGKSVQTNTYIDGIVGRTVDPADGISVLVSSTGQLGTVSSSRRYKQNIESINEETIKLLLSLEPKSFCYKNDDHKQYGLIAEEVNEKFPEMVVWKDGQIETVQYHQLYGLLLAGLKYLYNKIDKL